ncbi:MAG: type II/IV secretion system protein, partial [Betaproteobacteria bacterium]
MKPREFEAQPFTPQRLEAARVAAAASGRRLVACLEELTALEPEAFTAALAATLGGLPLTMAQMHALEPAFDLLPYAEALSREVALLREPDGARLLAHADPFDGRLRAWAAERIAEPVQLRAAHSSDIAAWLARQGENLRAMESVVLEAKAEGADKRSVQSLSLKSISEDASP